jgi:two-component system sensor histidine kinase RegB
VRDTLTSLFVPPISADPAQRAAKLAWIVRLRWIALSAQLLSIFPALQFDLLEERLLPAFLGVIALLATLNVATWAALRRGWSGEAGSALALQLGADITALSCLLVLTGGAWNPLVPILFVHAGLGALLLEGRQSFYFFALLIASLLLLQVFSHIPPGLEGTLVPGVILFPAQLVVAVVFWILTAWLSRTLSSLQNHFSLARERQTRIDRLRAVGALAAGLSHEFATPLNTAQLKLQRLRRRGELADDKDLATAMEALERCGEVLRHMAGAPLRPEAVNLEVVEVHELVEQLCSSICQDSPDLRVRLAVEGSGSLRAQLPTVAFSQALLNLIDNAVESAGPEPPVDVVVASQPGRIQVSVCDRGKGWPEVVRTHLGQPFVTTKPDGVGLGLYYVHTLAEAIGAELQVEDRSGGGAIARISLPSLPAAAEAR